jgi:type III restriction enzyme
MTPRAALPSDRFSVDQLVLHVSETVDPAVFNLSEYEDFIEALVRGREYQRESLEVVLRFLFGRRYPSSADLARESYKASENMQRLYATEDQLVQRLPFPEMLACSLDLATATGKSFVMYGLARIALNEGIVDRVLVLCPSLTIEEGLGEKFEALTADSELTDMLPDRAGTRIPDIVDAGSTVREGQICIENIHATYGRTGSSIADSFAGQGESTLVLSDEAHHVHSPQGKEEKLWKQFLLDPSYGFKYHVGVSGTCYVGNEYFTDVVYRYSIGTAMDERTIKEVYYLEKDDSTTDDARFQKLQNQHEKNRQTYGLKPLTIAITKSITAAEELQDALVDFLAERLPGGRTEAQSRVLIVTSSDKHAANVRKLKTVDRADDQTEWIVSVAMLSEGWDVKNVFQIYPHEKKAFNSKLLIAQVLGRGLRLPALAAGAPTPIVRVFNHQKWGPEVENLVHEVIDRETEIAQRPATRAVAPHFEIQQLVYDSVPTGIEQKQLEAPRKLEKITLHAQNDAAEETQFKSGLTSRVEVLTTKVINKRYPVEAVVTEVRQRLLDHDKRTGGKLAKNYPKATVRKLIGDGLKRLSVKDKEVSQENRQIILSSFGSLRQTTMRAGAVLAQKPSAVTVVKTSEMGATRERLSGITSTLGIFYDAESEKLGTPDDAAALRKAHEMRKSVPAFLEEVSNSFLFKSPVNVVLASHFPEREFVAQLFKQENAAVIKSWVKSPDVGFYKIEYSYQGTGGGTKRSSFNPDYFLLLETGDVVVVETKADDDNSATNVGKLKYATDHFKAVNELLARKRGAKRQYFFHFVSPRDYPRFFEALRNAKIDSFVSTLQAALKP